MAIQKNLNVFCDPEVAYDCAIKTLNTFKNTEKMYTNRHFYTVTATIYHRTPGETITMIKVFSVTIQPNENGNTQMQIIVDHLPSHAINAGALLVTIAEFLDRFSSMLNQIPTEVSTNQ